MKVIKPITIKNEIREKRDFCKSCSWTQHVGAAMTEKSSK